MVKGLFEWITFSFSWFWLLKVCWRKVLIAIFYIFSAWWNYVLFNFLILSVKHNMVQLHAYSIESFSFILPEGSFYILYIIFIDFGFHILFCHVSLQVSVAGSNSTVGTNVLISHNLPTQDYWYWIGVGALLAYAVLFNGLFTLALTFLNRKCRNEILILISKVFLQYKLIGFSNKICNFF